ncbi:MULTISPECIES: glycosyltransferase family 2 protein [Niastella]|uniref:Glycosyltransferase n=1 Tax=Niastella soli TaxID=2821487 RepID=A0ABS3Z4K2_9BACT|nr:glycosyltransferase family 2 protein [Niastella soli]MBO9204580.1 glycosyltransferase [Niastella soli]
MQSPLITIIIPSFNAAAFIREALDSLLQQSFTAFEVLVVDGVSKDNTVAIVQEIASTDNRVRIITEKDAGIYDAMNKGIRLAVGEWLYFLGADDALCNNQVLESVVKVLQETDADLVYGNVLMGDRKHEYDGPFNYYKLLTKNISHQAIFYNRKVFSLVGNYNIQYKGHADWAFNLSCFTQEGLKTRYIDKLIANFSVGGTSSQHDVPFLREVLLPAMLVFLQQTGSWLLKNLTYYDLCWRTFRNAGIRNKEQLATYSKGLPVPAALVSMVTWQGKVSPALLKKGLVSKSLMFFNFIINRGAIK